MKRGGKSDEGGPPDSQEEENLPISPPHMDLTAPAVGLQEQGQAPGTATPPGHPGVGGVPRLGPGQEWREYASGGGATFLAIVFTFPLNKAMFRQQVHNISPVEAVRQMLREGVRHVYRGLPSPLTMKTLSHSVMFGSYTQYSRLLYQNFHPALSKYQCKLIGASLAGASEATLMPLERVQVLMQDAKYNREFRNTPHALWALRRHGPQEYYRGVSAILLRNCLGNMVFFTQRERLKSSLPDSWRAAGSYRRHFADFFGGACLGALISTVFYPVNVAKAHMQLKIGGSFERLSTTFLWLLRERGWRGIFRGVHTNYTRSFLSWGIVNLAYENILHHLQAYW